ncbi:MAG TPA: thermonuclease family protein [Kiritimatiellia bacterium]|nr:thermonuclease family protein [Kiritimatiellia bacterium]HMP34933.1 thermonuclease family protein [Kiritimatiellia bacterium]
MKGMVYGVVLAGMIASFVAVEPAEAAKRWRRYDGCTIIEHNANDGDSFHVRVNKRRYLFRLYWVDAPETDNSVPERVIEQAAYFGISTQDAIKYGKLASKFAADFMKDGFTVHTKFADAMGRSARDRDYAIIEKDGKFLHIELVRAGLARIHGFQEVSDEMPAATTMRMRIKSAEAEAKKERRGAWSQGRGQGDTIAGTRVLNRSVTVLDVEDMSKAIGVLRAGASVELLGAETPTLIRIQFKAGEQDMEGLVQRADLGI